MISSDDVKKLALLSRLALSDEEVEKMKQEIDAIVSYIDAVQKVELPKVPEGSPYLDIENVMRDDANPHEGGLYTEALLAQAPDTKDGYLKVKKILG